MRPVQGLPRQALRLIDLTACDKLSADLAESALNKSLAEEKLMYEAVAQTVVTTAGQKAFKKLKSKAVEPESAARNTFDAADNIARYIHEKIDYSGAVHP